MKNRINNRRHHRWASLLALVLLATCTLVPTALTQRPGPIPGPIPRPIPRPTPPPRRPSPDEQRQSPRDRTRQVRIDSKVMRIPARAPIAFKPLEMIDPRTGQAVTPDTMLTLGNRRQITAAKYYEQMNQLEAGLNKLGHSFRDQQKEVVTNEVVVDQQRILAQVRSTRFSPPNRRTAARLDALAQAHRDYVRTVNPHFGKVAPRGFSSRVRSGLYQEKVGALLEPVSTVTPRSTFPKTRPDFVPGDREILGLGKDTEAAQLPGMSTNPGWAEDGVRATAVHVKASWTNVVFYVNYLNAPTGRLAQRYVWQVVATKRTHDPFGSFFKDWASEFDEQELVGWQTPGSMIRSGNAAFLLGSVQRQHLFAIDFAQVVGNPPAVSVDYLVRVVPVHADGSIAGYPSRPVLVTYGVHPEFKGPPIVIRPALPVPAKILANDIPRLEAPLSYGDPQVMSVTLKTWVESKGSPTEQSAKIGFEADGSVYGFAFPLLNMSGWGKMVPLKVDQALYAVTHPGETSAGVIIMVGPLDLCGDCEKSVPGSLTIPFDKSHSINHSFTLSFPIGPIDVSATVGIRGQIGVGGTVRLSPSEQTPFSISAGPHLSVAIYLEGGVGLGAGGYDVVSVGVDGTVNLISASFVVEFDLYSGSGGHYVGRITDLSTFGGNLNGWAKAGICPFCKKWSTNLYSWEGYNLLASNPERATLFEGSF
ncbi:MAG TPA: hypothetical protein VMS31_17965 [Pyrinomonadaceae bacterium]|nr:hypothetical protein [Pyrinomonadaceae bacterium]